MRIIELIKQSLKEDWKAVCRKYPIDNIDSPLDLYLWHNSIEEVELKILIARYIHDEFMIEVD